MSALTRRRKKSKEDEAVDVIDHHLFNLLYEIDRLEDESSALYTLARAHVFDKLDGCKKRNLLLLAESFSKAILTREFVAELIDRAGRWSSDPVKELDDPATVYSQRVKAEEEAYERIVSDDLPEFGPLDQVEVIYFNDAVCVHLVAPQTEPRLAITAVEDSWPDDWGEVDEQQSDMTLHHIGCHQEAV